MTGLDKLCLLAGAAIGALALPATSYAAEPATASVSEVVVTAEKREENLRDVPQSVTVVSGAALDLQRASSFEDYVTSVPGMQLVQGQPGSSRLVLRGVNSGGVSATIGTYVDEAPYGSVTGLANGAVLTPDLDTFDTQRIEVLRGPQGTLYGASSLGGLLKFVTIAPDTTHFSGRIQVDGDTTDSSSNGVLVRAAVNLPLNDMVAVRASGYYKNEPGFIDDPNRKAGNVNALTTSGGRGSVLFKPTDKLSVRLTAMFQDLSSKGTGVEDVNRLTQQPLYGDLTQSRAFSQPNRIEYRIYSGVINYDLGFGTLTSATSYGTLHQTLLADGTAQLGGLLSLIFHQPLGVSVASNMNQKKFTQEVRLASPAQQFEWLVGGFFTREQNDLAQNLSAILIPTAPQVAPGLGGLETVDLKSSYIEYAFFANVDYHFTDRFDISVGGRFSHNDQHDGQLTAGPLVGGASFVTGTSSDDVFTFAVAPKYKLSDHTTLYARVSKGYRPGGPNALQPLAPAAVPRTFAADTLINYEVGIKGDALDRQVGYDLTAFYIDWSDIQLLANVQNFGVNTNGGSATSKGVEGNVSWTPITEFTFSANAAYTEAHLTSATGPLLGGRDGDRLPFSAPITGALSWDYHHALGADLTGFLGMSARFTGRRRTDFNAVFGQASIPAYTTLDLRGGVELKNLRGEVFIKNASNVRGIESYGAPGTAPNGAAQLGLIRPRTVGVSLSASF